MTMREEKHKFLARVISRGRITIPDEIRELLNIKEGDLLEVTIKKVKEVKKK